MTTLQEAMAIVAGKTMMQPTKAHLEAVFALASRLIDRDDDEPTPEWYRSRNDEWKIKERLGE